MNKQQLASRIWESANNMRSKIEANEYKDYILGFIFYKFLSDKEENGLKADGWSDEDLQTSLVEEDEEMVKHCRAKYGYFISYQNLFSTWIKMGKDFDVSNVRDALSAFKRLINEKHKKVFDKIFDTLDTGLSKLGDNSGAQTKAISSLIALIDPIPMDDKQGYDVLGFIYEYLISMFAANAGKKAGEFYTPHEVSQIMSEIIANHLQDREKIEIYDPTSGSGSLLITIGKSVAKYLDGENKVKYYAQELKENTYSLTRMNLVMRGIIPENIVARNGDTLAEDWPYFEEGKRESTYEVLWVDAVVSNPPYSQKWEPKEDPRFSNYGIAPKTKADYAFLLHDLYHLKTDGIMAIVLPHGVLFRGNEEGNIRRNLIENDNIETIIGLPANIFFGTGIPTIVMILKKKRDNGDVLIVDASKGFEKVGKNNKLRASDIKKIVDTVIGRKTIEGYSRLVSKDEIRANDYNLNIPRYVDSSEKAESYDIYASMFGGIPNSEIDALHEFWGVFPTLKAELFKQINPSFSALNTDDVNATIEQNAEIQEFIRQFNSAFAGFDEYMASELIGTYDTVNIAREESVLADEIFKRIQAIPLLDKYDAYQLLDNIWQQIAIDLEIIKTEGEKAMRQVDARMVTKKKDGKEQEVQEGWQGHIIPFDLVKATILKAQADAIRAKENRSAEIDSEITAIFEDLSEDERSEIDSLITEEGDAFVNAEVTKYAKKAKKQRFAADSVDAKVVKVADLLEEDKTLKKEVKAMTSELDTLTKKTIAGLSDGDLVMLLKEKWICPLVKDLTMLTDKLLKAFHDTINRLAHKYDSTYTSIDDGIREAETALCGLLDELEGDEFDTLGLAELEKLLRGE